MDISAQFKHHFDCPSTHISHAPGRVNLIGEHVDYNDGPVLPAAIDRAVIIAAAGSADNAVHLHALDLEERVSFSLASLDGKIDLTGNPLPAWALYPAGVAWSLKAAGLDVRGLRAVYTSDVPIGAGLSSSAAIEVGFAALWQALGGWDINHLELARLCQRAENDYVGVPCGLMDQFASACGVEGHALYFDTRSLEWLAAPLPPGTSIVIADSGVRRSLLNSAYSERRASCERAVDLLVEYLPDIRSLRDVSPIELAAYGDYLPDEIRKRAEHIVKEIARVDSALNALRREDKRAFGALMYSSHTSMRNLYEISTPELDTLVDLTRRLPGCLGARLTGAGFGGCTVNLVDDSCVVDFIDGLEAGYKLETGRQAQVYLCRASQGVSIQEI